MRFTLYLCPEGHAYAVSADWVNPTFRLRFNAVRNADGTRAPGVLKLIRADAGCEWQWLVNGYVNLGEFTVRDVLQPAGDGVVTEASLERLLTRLEVMLDVLDIFVANPPTEDATNWSALTLQRAACFRRGEVGPSALSLFTTAPRTPSPYQWESLCVS